MLNLNEKIPCSVIGMAKVLHIVDVMGYDGQHSSFSSSPRSD